ncbi:MAG TPA: hypothetical protein VGK77_01565 [Candidatus Binatia bacterium]|jgi:hypothetical protein
MATAKTTALKFRIEPGSGPPTPAKRAIAYCQTTFQIEKKLNG